VWRIIAAAPTSAYAPHRLGDFPVPLEPFPPTAARRAPRAA